MLKVYNGAVVVPLGIYKGMLTNKKTGMTLEQEFVVVESAGISLLGLEACQKLKLMSVNYENIAALHDKRQVERLTEQRVLELYADVFRDELGCFSKGVHLEVDESVTPTKLAAKRLPIAVAQDVQRELDRFEKQV